MLRHQRDLQAEVARMRGKQPSGDLVGSLAVGGRQVGVDGVRGIE